MDIRLARAFVVINTLTQEVVSVEFRSAGEATAFMDQIRNVHGEHLEVIPIV